MSMHHTRLNKIYEHMKDRCYNPKHDHYKYYGARGIGVCSEWRESYKVFKEWALSHGYTDKITIDRIDNDKDYCPENCRWITLQATDGVGLTPNRCRCDTLNGVGVTPNNIIIIYLKYI